MKRAAIESEWKDVSIALHNGMVHWPGDPDVKIEKTSDIDRGDPANVSAISMGSHTGTHVDAPYHFIRSGKKLDQMPLDTLIGPARVIEIHDPKLIRAEVLVQQKIQPGERILFKTNNSKHWKTDSFVENFVSISEGAANYLAKEKIKMVGIDYLSVGGYLEDGAKIHRIFLEAGIWILEGLDLSEVRDGCYELIALPLKIKDGDGAPARAVIRRITNNR